MPADPFEALASPVVPLRPRADFADQLRRRLERLVTQGGTVPTTPYKPPTRHDVTPYIAVEDSRRALDWYGEVFGAEVTYEPIVMDDGRVGHVEFRIGDTTIQMSDAFPDLGVVAPTRGGRSVSFSVYVPDVDATFAKALSMGAVSDRPPEDQFYGDRTGWLADPFGHVWSVHTWLGETDH